MSVPRSIGIDLGHRYAYVAVSDRGKPVTCVNDYNDYSTPAYVCYTDTDVLVGVTAKEQSYYNKKSTIYDVNRFIGQAKIHPEIQEDWQFDLIEMNNSLSIKINIKGEDKLITPEEISGLILVKLKEFAEIHLGHDVNGVVIVVPNDFNDKQRELIMKAAALAHLNVLKIITESVASVIALNLTRNDSKERFVLVYDLGCTSFNSTILRLYNNKVENLAIARNNKEVCGNKFTENIVDYCLKFFERVKGINIKEIQTPASKRALNKLETACEVAKQQLSTVLEATIYIDCLYEGLDFYTTITRALFELLNIDIFNKTINIAHKCIADSKLEIDKNDLEIVIVGGSTRIPRIQALIAENFSNNVVHKRSYPEQIKAHGAAILAEMIEKKTRN